VGILNHTRLVWIPEDEPGIEDVRIVHDATGVRVSSTLVRLLEGLPLRVSYLLRCDTEWRVRELQMTGESELAGDHALHLLADGVGGWQNDADETIASLHGCIDVDIMVTPLTNTLPIRRLALAPGESREIRVVYVSAPDLSIRPFRQRYTRLDDLDGHQRFRYESLEGGFTADLPVDDDGFVVGYRDIWRRVWPTS
jgi:hypothetical protein